MIKNLKTQKEKPIGEYFKYMDERSVKNAINTNIKLEGAHDPLRRIIGSIPVYLI